MRALVVVVALFGCKGDAPSPAVASGSAPAVAKACENVDLALASAILGDAAHPCRARVDAAYGRMMATGMPFSGTLVSTRPTRGAGLFVTCQHCAGPAGDGLHDPEIEDPSTIQSRAPAQLLGTKVQSGRETQIFFIHRLFSPLPPKSAFDTKGHLSQIEPRHDFVVATISGAPVEVVGHLGALPSATVSDTKLAVHDPQRLLASAEPTANPAPGTQVLLLGFPRDLPDHAFAGELVASVGEVLDDARAKDMLGRADADEAAIPYDPTIEFVVTARAASGMSGGGAFDAAHRYLGVLVRGTVTEVDGKYLTRVVRARYILEQLDGALSRAPAPLRDKLTPFVLR
jgi:Trypsin-like peptidase domain